MATGSSGPAGFWLATLMLPPDLPEDAPPAVVSVPPVSSATAAAVAAAGGDDGAQERQGQPDERPPPHELPARHDAFGVGLDEVELQRPHLAPSTVENSKVHGLPPPRGCGKAHREPAQAPTIDTWIAGVYALGPYTCTVNKRDAGRRSPAAGLAGRRGARPAGLVPTRGRDATACSPCWTAPSPRTATATRVAEAFDGADGPAPRGAIRRAERRVGGCRGGRGPRSARAPGGGRRRRLGARHVQASGDRAGGPSPASSTTCWPAIRSPAAARSWPYRPPPAPAPRSPAPACSRTGRAARCGPGATRCSPTS